MTFRVVLRLNELVPAGLQAGRGVCVCVCVCEVGVCGGVGVCVWVGVCVCLTGRAGKSLVHLALFGEIGFCPGGLVGGAFELRWRLGVLELPVGGGEPGSPLGAHAGDGVVGSLAEQTPPPASGKEGWGAAGSRAPGASRERPGLRAVGGPCAGPVCTPLGGGSRPTLQPLPDPLWAAGVGDLSPHRPSDFRPPEPAVFPPPSAAPSPAPPPTEYLCRT